MSCGSDATTLPFPSTNSNVTFTGREGLEWKFEYRPSRAPPCSFATRSEEHTSELQSRVDLVCRLLLEKKNRFSTVAASYPARGPASFRDHASGLDPSCSRASCVASRCRRSRRGRDVADTVRAGPAAKL